MIKLKSTEKFYIENRGKVFCVYDEEHRVNDKMLGETIKIDNEKYVVLGIESNLTNTPYENINNQICLLVK